MYPTIFHIYGPFSINSYGCMIAIGLIIFLWLLLKDPRRATFMSIEQCLNAITIGIISGIVGGRALYIFSEWNRLEHWSEIFELWHGGLSILGCIISILIIGSLYLKMIKVPILPFLDLIALYTPLLQGISRIGCFLAGCCYGKVTSLPWAITYNHPEIVAPLHIPLHPTQLYSAAVLISIFLLLYFVIQHKVTQPGHILTAYLMLMSIERWAVDVLRADQQFFMNTTLSFFSLHQWIALIIFVIAGISFFSITYYPNKL